VNLTAEPYLAQVNRWPKTGRHILAQYDDNSVIVYQAYRPAIADFALQNGYFGGEFNLNRMSWIKPNFLWIMYRSGWGTKEGQEVVLAVRLNRTAFDQILAAAVHSNFVPEVYETQQEWQRVIKSSSVRLQWDPDHHPKGTKLERRAIQLGLRSEVLAKYAKDWLIDLEDISEFVRQQYKAVQRQDWENLLTPSESVYPVTNTEVATKLGLSHSFEEVQH
jgi:Domain of unknown function (DUF4291)